MRFYVPNSELDSVQDDKKSQKEEKKKEEKKEKTSEDGSEDEEEEPELTAAQVFKDKITKAAGLGEFAGDMITSLAELPMIIPRGKYSFQLYPTFAKLHGKTNVYKIQY